MSNKPRKTNTEKPEELRLSRGRTRPEAIFPVAPSAASLPESYAATLQEIKTHLRNSRVRAVLAANPIVIEACWNTEKIILERQKEAAWGAKVIDRLATDLQKAFPDMGGLSSRNLLAMKVFAREFPDSPIAQQPVAQLPWGHILQIIQRSKDPATRDFYIRFKAEKSAKELADIAATHQLATAALQTFVDGILDRMIFDGERLSDLMAPLDLGWKARSQPELALTKVLRPLLIKRAGGRDISGLSAYEQ